MPVQPAQIGGRIPKPMKKTATFIAVLVFAIAASAQDSSVSDSESIYRQASAFALNGGSASVTGTVIKKDRVTISLTGTIYFGAKVDGRVTGAVFIGQGRVSVVTPPAEFEKKNLQRLIGADTIESDFTEAVFRLTDGSLDSIAAGSKPESAAANAVKLARDTDPRISQETGANLPARIAISIQNQEDPGFFFVTFSGGKRGAFSYAFDPQTRIPSTSFGINGGEKGVIWSYDGGISYADVWTAFASEEDYKNGVVAFSDAYDLIDIIDYSMDIDIRDPGKQLGIKARIAFSAKYPGVKAIPFYVGESLGEGRSERLKRQMRISSATAAGAAVSFAQEDWDSGFVVFLKQPPKVGEPVVVEFELAGDFMQKPEGTDLVYYPRSNSTWYPRHGFLDRSTYTLKFDHESKLAVASVGERTAEADKDADKYGITTYKIDQPVSLVTFAYGRFEVKEEDLKFEDGKTIPLEYFSLRGDFRTIKEEFILAEMNNALRYFRALFGDYPYSRFSAVFHPYPFGQGFASILLMPKADRESKFVYSFIAHETAHQWWGNIVAWRSYRDQWLSEGFAEYSGVLYTALRDSPKAADNLIDRMRDEIDKPTQNLRGQGKDRDVDVGAIISGRRLNSSEALGVYQNLVYNKGALVLRMIHFLMSDPSTGDDKAFFEMMKDFVSRYRNKVASTEDFRAVAGEHFAKTPIAQKYGLKGLNWFFDQWVYGAYLPAYRIEYSYQDVGNGQVAVKGEVIQENAGKDWFMPLPISFDFGNGQFARGTIIAYGERQPFEVKLPAKPKKTDVDVKKWILSEKTETVLKK